MASLTCDICGGKLIMGAGEIATCESCGLEHTRSRLQEKIQEIKGVVKIDGPVQIEGMQTAESLYKNGETFLTFGDYEKARAVFQELADRYPTTYYGWWGLILCKTNNLQNYMALDAECAKYLDRVKQLAPDAELEEMSKRYCEKEAAKVHGESIQAKKRKIETERAATIAQIENLRMKISEEENRAKPVYPGYIFPTYLFKKPWFIVVFVISCLISMYGIGYTVQYPNWCTGAQAVPNLVALLGPLFLLFIQLLILFIEKQYNDFCEKIFDSKMGKARKRLASELEPLQSEIALLLNKEKTLEIELRKL